MDENDIHEKPSAGDVLVASRLGKFKFSTDHESMKIIDLESKILGDDNEDETEYQSESDETVRLVQNEPTKPRKITQKKTVEQANFSKWLSKNRLSLSQKAAKRSNVQDKSLHYMVKSCEGGEKIINSPRDYQLELFEKAKHENTIAVLDTGKSS